MVSQHDAELERQHLLIFENVGVGVLVHALDGTLLRANSEARRLLGLRPWPSTEVHGEGFELVGEDGAALPESDYPAQQVAATGVPVKGVVAGFRRPATNEITWLAFNAFPIYGREGEITLIVASFDDLANSPDLQSDARRDRERLELASRATRSVVFDWNLQTEEFWANDNFRAIFGFPPPSRLRLSDAPQYVFEEDRKHYQGLLFRALENKDERLKREFRFIRSDGALGVAQSEFLIQYSKGGQPVRIIGSKRDLTELRRKEERLAASEERFRIVAALSSDMLWELDPETGLVWRAPDGLERLGVDPEFTPELKGVWEDLIAPEDRLRVMASFGDALRGRAQRWRAEYHIQRSGGSSLLVEDRAAIIRSESGEATRVVGAVRDITESRRIEEFMRESQALEALGKLTGGVAHDFNNMLMIIMGNTEILMDEVVEPDAVELLKLIEAAARNGAELTSRLLSFARQQPLAPRRIDIADQMEQAAKLIRHVLPGNIGLAVDVEARGLFARVDASQLDNALVNLAINSRDAMPEGGSITLEASQHQVEPGPGEAVLPPGDYVKVMLCDTGSGMEPSVLARVFEPFFTTKPTGEGTGLGLSMVYGFAKQSGGHALVESASGHGTCVTIFLPAAREAASDHGDPVEIGVASKGHAKILVVEDDEEVRNYLERILGKEGFTVLSAAGPVAALEMLDEHDDIDLLFTDFLMPGGIDGQQLVEEARRRRPGLEAVLTSGYASGAKLGDGVALDDVTLLQKPYRRADLLHALAGAGRAPPGCDQAGDRGAS